jgi:hypothetical protein
MIEAERREFSRKPEKMKQKQHLPCWSSPVFNSTVGSSASKEFLKAAAEQTIEATKSKHK